jgi:hypothetical protein
MIFAAAFDTTEKMILYSRNISQGIDRYFVEKPARIKMDGSKQCKMNKANVIDRFSNMCRLKLRPLPHVDKCPDEVIIEGIPNPPPSNFRRECVHSGIKWSKHTPVAKAQCHELGQNSAPPLDSSRLRP